MTVEFTNYFYLAWHLPAKFCESFFALQKVAGTRVLNSVFYFGEPHEV